MTAHPPVAAAAANRSGEGGNLPADNGYGLYGLRVDSRVEPLGVDVPDPAFSWRARTPVRGEYPVRHRLRVWQEAYTEREALWDSGDVPFAGANRVAYGGRPLESLTTYRWDIEVTTGSGEVVHAESRFTTGILHPDEWKADWIRRDLSRDPARTPPEPDDGLSDRVRLLQAPSLLRRSFTVDAHPARVFLAYTAKGVVRPFLNGQRIDDAELVPGWTEYRHRIPYRVVDVTSHVRLGENTLGALLGDGWWAGMVGFDPRRQGAHYGEQPELLAQLVVQHGDGSRRLIGTDRQWQEARGSLRFSDLMMGEWCDGRVDDAAWLRGGGERAWSPVIAEPHGSEVLVSERDEPVRVIESRGAVTATEREPGRWILDFGQNLVGRLRVRFLGLERDRRVRLRHAEALAADGELYVANLRTAEATDRYISSGAQEQIYEPVFTVHGFRYAEIDLGGSRSAIIDASAEVLHNDLPEVGEFECSSPLVNQLHSNIRWGLKGNFVAVPTDCPQRDERLGWLADAQVFTPTALLHVDAEAFYRRWLRDVVLAQAEDGAYRNFVPSIQTNQRAAAPGWGDAGVIIPWEVYRATGDRAVLAENYRAMTRWVDRIAALNPDRLWANGVGNNYGDWLQLGAETPKELVATAYFARSADLVSAAATALDDSDGAARYSALREEVRTAFCASFVDEGTGVVGSGSQTGYLMALAWDLLPEGVRPRAAERLIADIRERGTLLTTGFMGVSLLCPTLDRFGYADVALALLQQTAFPSWGYSIERGATTIWERWDGWTEERGFQTPDMNSLNHYSLGSVGEWLFHGVAGLDQQEDSAGYRRIRVHPAIGGGLSYARASYESALGRVAVAWETSAGRARVEIEVPPGAEARTHLPVSSESDVRVGGKPLADAGGVVKVRVIGTEIVIDFESGTYEIDLAHPILVPAAEKISEGEQQ